MKITVIGSGYVGLVAGACLADAGNEVTCADIDEAKVERLQRGEVPFYEPGLEALVQRNARAQRLCFTTDVEAACTRGAVIFIAVGTPQGDDGSAELRFVHSVADTIGASLSGVAPGEQIEGLKVVLTKSTVPIGTSDEVHRRIGARAEHPYVVCSNPEFLKEGDALNDFLKPDRVILGVPDDERGVIAERVVRRMYASFCRTNDRLMVMGVRSSEMTKYAANAMLATKISFMNEMSRLAEAVGADIERVRVGIGSDPRIGYSFLFAGAGYGGSCFPKDVRALQHIASKVGPPLRILRAVDEVNERQKEVLFQRAREHYQGALSGKRFAVWGLAFKPRTDDMREAPSLVLIKALLEAGASVSAYDPESMSVTRALLQAPIDEGRVQLMDGEGQDHYSCLEGADALFVVTEWKVFHHPDFKRLCASLAEPVVFDGRNIYDPDMMKSLGVTYYGMGRGTSIERGAQSPLT